MTYRNRRERVSAETSEAKVSPAGAACSAPLSLLLGWVLAPLSVYAGHHRLAWV